MVEVVILLTREHFTLVRLGTTNDRVVHTVGGGGGEWQVVLTTVPRICPCPGNKAVGAAAAVSLLLSVAAAVTTDSAAVFEAKAA